MVRRASLLSILLFLIFSLPATSRAQASLEITISPDYPKPGEVIFMTITGYSIDLGSSHIRWLVNGRTAEEGIGKRSITVTMGPAGSHTSVSVNITTPTGSSYQDGIIIFPAEVTLLWESDGYTPPFYKGAAPYVSGGRLTFTAIPEFFKNGTRVNPKDLIYTWRHNGKAVQNASGYGKNTFSTNEASYLRPDQEVSVEVTSPSNDFVARAVASVPYTSPKLVLYEDHPLYGVLFEKAIGDQMTLSKNEISLFRAPYFFSQPSDTETPWLSTVWLIDGRPVSGYVNKDKVTLRKSNPFSSSSVVRVSTNNPSESGQIAEESVYITIPPDEN